MKPTQEQVIEWARDCGAAVEGKDIIVAFEIGELESFVALAYEAGRKDENEACAKVCFQMWDKWVDSDRNLIDCPDAEDCGLSIRARREQ